MATTTGNNQDQWHSGETWNAAHTSSVQWTVPVRYQNLTYIGQGAFGAVLRATDTKTNKPVAIKKLFRPFFSGTHAKRTYRELRLLQHLNHPDAQVIQLYNVFTPEKTLREFQTLYFVFNFVDFDLHRVIARRNPFTEDHIQQIVYSILRGLKFIHSANIIHRDLTPRNVGISQTSDVTILDFGLARVASDGLQTGYVVARWWRAPEVMVNWEQYNNKLDVWSVGCIMAQLVRLSPLFPGTDYPDQVRRIIGVTGTPTEQELNELCQEEARLFILNEVPNVPPADFHALFPTLSENGIDLLKRFLRFDPRQRPTVEQALAHPFLATYHDPAAEPTATPIEGLHEDAEYPVEKWKEMTWQLIQGFQEPAWALEPAAQETP